MNIPTIFAYSFTSPETDVPTSKNIVISRSFGKHCQQDSADAFRDKQHEFFQKYGAGIQIYKTGAIALMPSILLEKQAVSFKTAVEELYTFSHEIPDAEFVDIFSEVETANTDTNLLRILATQIIVAYGDDNNCYFYNVGTEEVRGMTSFIRAYGTTPFYLLGSFS